jgi:alkylation response protein AidB-like acyl-CoA dehydrogenase
VIDFSLTPEQLQLQQVAREFARDHIHPLAAEYDRRTSPDETFPWEIYEKGNELGFNKALIPEKLGGPGLGNLDVAIMLEELAWGDVGVPPSARPSTGRQGTCRHETTSIKRRTVAAASRPRTSQPTSPFPLASDAR